MYYYKYTGFVTGDVVTVLYAELTCSEMSDILEDVY